MDRNILKAIQAQFKSTVPSTGRNRSMQARVEQQLFRESKTLLHEYRSYDN